MTEDEIIGLFPKLKSDNCFKITSWEDCQYNCIAWAMLYTDRWVQPPKSGIGLDGIYYYWPDGIDKSGDIKSLVDLFTSKGYSICTSSDFEEGYRKVALYVDEKNNRGTHAARQKPDGLWSSKLGRQNDIAHSTPEAVENDDYGKVAFIMKKKV